MIEIEPKDKTFIVRNHHDAIIASLKIHKGAFGLYLFYTQEIEGSSIEQLEEIVNFMKRFEKKHRY